MAAEVNFSEKPAMDFKFPYRVVARFEKGGVQAFKVKTLQAAHQVKEDLEKEKEPFRPESIEIYKRIV